MANEVRADLRATVGDKDTGVDNRYQQLRKDVQRFVLKQFVGYLPDLKIALLEPTEKTREVEQPNLLDPTVTRKVIVPAADPRGVVTERLRRLLDQILAEQQWVADEPSQGS